MTSIPVTAARQGGHAGLPARAAVIARRLGALLSQEVLLQAVVLLAVAVITRSPRLGDPAITGDEQFYLLVGDRLWHGALPFVDIWDRKPIGLFLLYGLFRPLSQDGVLAYQVAALLFAAATAFVLARIARRVAPPVAATIAAALYLVYLPIIGGSGGQSPVFYDLFTASAALLVVRCLCGDAPPSLWRSGLAAMLLVGLAMQVKYTALFEGMAFGLTLLWLRWRHDKALVPLAGFAMSLIATALAPTLLAFVFYAMEGHARAFLMANFVSIFQKSEPSGFSEVNVYLVTSALKMAPALLLLAVAIVGAEVRPRTSPVQRFALLWTGFTLAEFFAIGHYYDHYAIPLLMPSVIVMASLFDWTPFAIAAVSLTVSYLLVTCDTLSTAHMLRNRAKIAALTQVLSPYARQGCIYINDGPPILYLTTRSCLPTRYPFPGHLTDAEEARATDAVPSMTALLQTHPPAIVMADKPRLSARNPVTDKLVGSVLAADYHLEATLPDILPRNAMIYVRNDLR